jgi:hypothetical protein
MIMNKKIFTLLAGTLFLLGTVFTAKAQFGETGSGSAIDVKLGLGRTVPELKAGINTGYYHLKVDSIAFFNTSPPYTNSGSVGTGSGLNNSLVLFLRDSTEEGSYKLYIDSINTMRSRSNNDPLLNTYKSASSLWCVNVLADQQGGNNIFDFTNKEFEELLDVSVDGYYSGEWGTINDLPGDTSLVSGGVSGWHFSEIFMTGLDRAQPLYSYLTRDTVAVLALNAPTSASLGTLGNVGDLDVVVKIVHLNELYRVQGLLLFTLVEPKAFVLDKNDINTKFGHGVTGATVQKFKFSQDVDDEHYNPFSEDGIWAEHIESYSTIPAVDTGRISLDSLVAANWLDTLGYLWVKKSETSHSYLYVDTTYYTYVAGSADDRYLRLAWSGNRISTDPGDLLRAWNSTPASVADSLMYPQYAFRFVYNPFDDNIKINSYKANYYPEGYPKIELPHGGHATNYWTDSASQAWYTFAADTNILSGISSTTPWSDVMAADLDGGRLTTNQVTNVAERFLLNGQLNSAPAYVDPQWRYWQKLYLDVQNISTDKWALTLANTPAKQITFDVYAPCAGGDSYRASVPVDLYLIRNTKGEFLRVPLYSATDSCEWEELEPGEHPERMPSYQWIVEKQYNSDYSAVTLINREFPWLKFKNVQLQKEEAPFKLRGGNFQWNKENVNAKVVLLSDVDFSKKTDIASFVSIDNEGIRKDPLLGYTWIDPDSAVVNLFAFNFNSKIDPNHYVGWNGDLRNYPAVDTTLRVNFETATHFNKMFFRLDTVVGEDYGNLKDYGYKVAEGSAAVKALGIAQLKRQAYRLSYEDPVKYRCNTNFSVTNGENAYYAIAPKGSYKDILGKPVFYLRHTYHTDSAEPYFALVQTIDSTSIWDPSFHTVRAAFEEYLKEYYSSTVATHVINALETQHLVNSNNGWEFNPGLFVMSFDDQTGVLKADVRASVVTRISTFRMEKDTDPIYRRFDQAQYEGPGDGTERDAPKTVKFFQFDNRQNFLYENAGSPEFPSHVQYWTGQQAGFGERNYLGDINVDQYPAAKTMTNIYVDTAYVNRGTGYIKPQYMLVIDPDKTEVDDICNPATGQPIKVGEDYLRGKFLINANDSAHKYGTLHKEYMWNTQWERLIFVDAVHARDYLFILEGLGNDLLKTLTWDGTSSGVVNIDKLVAASKTMVTDPVTNLQVPQVTSIFLGDNTHKDCVFSFRLIERDANDFLIESESNGRGVEPIIRPCEGGWVKIQNNVPMISRATREGIIYVDAMIEGTVFNVSPGDGGLETATGSEAVETAKVTVIGGNGAITVQGAAGKRVVITNVLGQSLTNTVLTSDNATVTVPSGIVVVSVEGEKAVKAIVK